MSAVFASVKLATVVTIVVSCAPTVALAMESASTEPAFVNQDGMALTVVWRKGLLGWRLSSPTCMHGVHWEQQCCLSLEEYAACSSEATSTTMLQVAEEWRPSLCTNFSRTNSRCLHHRNTAACLSHHMLVKQPAQVYFDWTSSGQLSYLQ